MAHPHERYMRLALALSKRNLGQTWPNPCVGAVIVKDGQIVGTGVTARGGRPHAETEAFAGAGDKARGATLYVTLEPCAHHGKTLPCVDAVIKHGIREVVIACRDPNPLVAGKGVEQLRAVGIRVTENICTKEASEIHRGFFSVIEKKRPFISLKIATSLDGKMTTPSGQSKWITGEKARAYGHLLRSRYDAIATGIGTVLADDPLLTCRLPGLENRSPVRVVFDRNGRLSAASNLMKTAKDIPVWTENGDIAAAVSRLAEKGITRLLVEAGPQLSTAFLQSGLVHRMYWFRAPLIIGGDGLSAPGEYMQRWQLVERHDLQPDTLEVFECSPAS